MADFFAPSYWYGAGPDFSGLANAQASQAQTNNFNAQQANTLGQANAYNPYANSGGSFGAMPAYYAALAAAYGRQTGGFANTPAGYAAARYGGGGIGGENARDQLAQTMSSGGGIGSDAARAPNQPVYSAANLARYRQYMTPDAIEAYTRGLANQSGADNTEMFDRGGINNLAANGGNRPAAPMAGDIGFSRQPLYPNLGYNPGMGNSFANPGMNANPFQNRFGLGFGGQGTPSQYAPGAQMPPGFSQPYGADNEGGALPLMKWMNPNPGS